MARGLTPDLEEGMTPEARRMAENEKKEAIEKKLYGKALGGGGFSENYNSAKTRTLGQNDNLEKGNSKLKQFAASGGLHNLDRATLSRMIDSLSPAQAEAVIGALKNK